MQCIHLIAQHFWVYLIAKTYVYSLLLGVVKDKENNLGTWGLGYKWQNGWQHTDGNFVLGARVCELESHQFQCSHENWVCLKFPWTRNSLLFVSWKLVWNPRSWSWLQWLIMVWIGYSSPCGCSSPRLMVSHGMVCLWATVISKYV